METSSIYIVLVLIVLLLLQIWITATYYAITNASRKSLKDLYESENNRRAGQTLFLSDHFNQLALIYQFIAFVFAMVGAFLFVQLISDPLETELINMTSAETDILLLHDAVLLLVLIPYALGYLFLGHLLPIAAISGRSVNVALMMTPFIRILFVLLSPLLSFLERFSHQLGVMLGGDGNISHITEEEIKTMVDVGSEEGIIEDDEKDMIYSVFKFGDTLVREVMVPRIDIIALPINASLEETLNTITQVGHSRIPIFEDTIDNIKGFLYAKDMLSMWAHDQTKFFIKDVMRDPYFVPESKNADDLLEEFRTRETHIAIVSDKYGGTAGLVTLEDLVEEIVGEIRDEYDFYEEAAYEQINDSEYVCSASLDLDDLNELFGASLPTDENDTLGGFIFSHLEKIPEVGDTIVIHQLSMEVLTLKGERRIDKVRIKKIPREHDTMSETEIEVDDT